MAISYTSILIAGQAKTGTTALFFKVKNSLPQGTKCFFEPTSFDCENLRGSDPVLAKILLGPVKTIDYDSFLCFQKHVVIVRDPRDRLVSQAIFSVAGTDIHRDTTRTDAVLAFLRRKEKEPDSISFLDLVETVGRQTDPEFSFGKWKEFIRSQFAFFYNYCDTRSHFLVRYEDIVRDSLAELEGYLGFKILPGEAVMEPHASHVPRTKGTGDWKNWFLEKDVAFLRELCDEYLGKFGYEHDWDLPDRRHVRSEYCSGYVRRLLEKRLAVELGTYRI